MAELTRSQKEVAKWLVRGYTAKEIGKVLGRSYKTIEVHREAIYKTLGCRNIVDLVRMHYTTRESVTIGLPSHTFAEVREMLAAVGHFHALLSEEEIDLTEFTVTLRKQPVK